MRRKYLWILTIALLLSALFCAASAERASISMGGKLGLMYEGDEAQLKPKLRGVGASQLRWSSSDERAVAVENGKITAKAAGRAIVTVSGGGASARCGIVVLPKIVELEVGEIVALPNGTLEKYAVWDDTIAKVSRKGLIGGVKEGETLVRVRYGKQTLFVGVRVKSNAASAPEAQQSAAAQLDCADAADQIVLVEHKGGSSAQLSIHEKRNGVWKELYRCGAYVGRNGIDKTREGDGKTPTGTFNLTQPFGIKPDPGAQMDYTQVKSHHYWCGTSGSAYYNQLVDAREVNRPAGSSDEVLVNYKGYYDYCLFIDYNASGAAGKGSCIFLHCMGGKESTAGCIAIPEKVMKKLVQWVEPGAKIVIR